MTKNYHTNESDDGMTNEELAFALRELEQVGIFESRMGDDGEIYYRWTGKALTDEISDCIVGKHILGRCSVSDLRPGRRSVH